MRRRSIQSRKMSRFSCRQWSASVKRPSADQRNWSAIRPSICKLAVAVGGCSGLLEADPRGRRAATDHRLPADERPDSRPRGRNRFGWADGWTVRIFQVALPIAQIRSLACDPDSHTSVALARIILAQRYGLRPEMSDLSRAGRRGGNRARLLIGDKGRLRGASRILVSALISARNGRR